MHPLPSWTPWYQKYFLLKRLLFMVLLAVAWHICFLSLLLKWYLHPVCNPLPHAQQYTWLLTYTFLHACNSLNIGCSLPDTHIHTSIFCVYVLLRHLGLIPPTHPCIHSGYLIVTIMTSPSKTFWITLWFFCNIHRVWLLGFYV